MPVVVMQINTPEPPVHLPHLPGFSHKGTKILTAAAAVVISVSMISFVAYAGITSSDQFKKAHNLTPTNSSTSSGQPTNGSNKSKAALPGAGIATGVGGTTGDNSPVVTLTADPASVPKGSSSQLKWTVTNNPTECTASEDWSGPKAPSGFEKTQALTQLQSYLFTLTCKNATGTGFATVSVGAIAQSGTGNVATRPSVSLAANPSSIYVGDLSTLTWSATNNPTGCTASGDWSGAKSTSGPASTGALTSVKTYTYTLTCSNSGGTGTASATVAVNSLPPDIPIVFLSSNPVGPVTPGTMINLTWAVTNSASNCTAATDWSGAKATGGGSQNVGPLSSIKTYIFDITCSNSSGSTFDSAAVLVLPNPPSVALTVSPSSIFVGNNSTLTWSASNSPTSCTASGDWSGTKAASGTQSTGVLATAKTYLYSISCVNAGGTGFANNIALNVALPPAPVVSLSASPISITTGNSSTLTWSASNSPTSCTASGDWSGSKAASGTQSTGTLSTIKTYTYTLSCGNAGGNNNATTSVSVSSGAPPVSPPAVTISVSPSTIGTGSSSTISWSATNSPTSCTASNAWSGSQSSSGSTSTGTKASAGSFTYTMTCSNSAGSGAASATLTVIAIPVVSLTLSPTTINTGSSANISWSATNSPSSCTAGGSWSGSKASSGGPVTTGVMSTAGTFTYSLSCTNAGGSGSASQNLTVNNPAPVYCGGLTPCYGPNDLATHAAVGNCWGWNVGNSTFPWVINITSFRPNHPGGTSSGSLESTVSTCNKDITNVLNGSAGISGYKASGNKTTFNHSSSTKNNSSGSSISSYRTGYYDVSKP